LLFIKKYYKDINMTSQQICRREIHEKFVE
jgi:hypothetical protein